MSTLKSVTSYEQFLTSTATVPTRQLMAQLKSLDLGDGVDDNGLTQEQLARARIIVGEGRKSVLHSASLAATTPRNNLAGSSSQINTTGEIYLAGILFAMSPVLFLTAAMLSGCSDGGEGEKSKLETVGTYPQLAASANDCEKDQERAYKLGAGLDEIFGEYMCCPANSHLEQFSTRIVANDCDNYNDGDSPSSCITMYEFDNSWARANTVGGWQCFLTTFDRMASESICVGCISDETVPIMPAQ